MLAVSFAGLEPLPASGHPWASGMQGSRLRRFGVPSKEACRAGADVLNYAVRQMLLLDTC